MSSKFLPESKGKQVVLASKSPRRAELLGLCGIRSFKVHPSTHPEDLPKELAPAEYARLTAVAKGEDVFRDLSRLGQDDVIVLSADTVVEGEPGRIWEKPADAADARSMLTSLSGRAHNVHTGVALVTSGTMDSFVVTTAVTFVDLEEDDIDAYIEGGSPMDKAGAYGIQDGWMVESIQGDYFAVVGLPVSRVAKAIKKLLVVG